MTKDVMNIHARLGSKVVFAFPNNGYPYQGFFSKKAGLKVGSTYTVLYTTVESSSSTVVLAEFPDKGFNTVLFADAVQAITEENQRLDKVRSALIVIVDSPFYQSYCLGGEMEQLMRRALEACYAENNN